MSSLLPNIKPQFFDVDGNPLVGGKLHSYASGTSSPIATYSDYQALIPNTNPIILDSNGEANVYLADGSYKFILTDSEDVTRWTVDNIVTSDLNLDVNLLPKYTYDHSDFQASNLTNTITSFSLPAKTLLECVILKHAALFSGPSISSYKISVGIVGDETLFVDNFDVVQTVADQTFEIIDIKYIGSFSLATDIVITATAIGANLDQSLTGSLEIFYKTKGMN